MGIYIHNLLDNAGEKSEKGSNPFEEITVGEGEDKKKLSSIVKAYNPPHTKEHIRL